MWRRGCWLNTVKREAPSMAGSRVFIIVNCLFLYRSKVRVKWVTPLRYLRVVHFTTSGSRAAWNLELAAASTALRWRAHLCFTVATNHQAKSIFKKHTLALCSLEVELQPRGTDRGANAQAPSWSAFVLLEGCCFFWLISRRRQHDSALCTCSVCDYQTGAMSPNKLRGKR